MFPATLPRLTSVTPTERAFVLQVRWASGEETEVDVSEPIMTNRLFTPLRNNPDLFNQVRVVEHGIGILWTDEIDLSAVMLWRLTREAASLTD